LAGAAQEIDVYAGESDVDETRLGAVAAECGLRRRAFHLIDGGGGGGGRGGWWRCVATSWSWGSEGANGSGREDDESAELHFG